MDSKLSTKRLEAIASKYNTTIKLNESDDDAYIDCEISNNDMQLYVIFTRFGDRYYAYSLNSDIAPSELYLDLDSRKPSDLEKREDEIFHTIDLLLGKKIVFHRKPSFFNKQRGYIELTVDGKPLKLMQKGNLLKLPES